MSYTPPTQLTFEQKIIAAYLHFVCDMNQQHIAIGFGGINVGRVNEAIKAIEAAAEKA
jgi:hypothetical protein